jgi:hypothetical protein
VAHRGEGGGGWDGSGVVDGEGPRLHGCDVVGPSGDAVLERFAYFWGCFGGEGGFQVAQVDACLLEEDVALFHGDSHLVCCGGCVCG